MLEDKEIDALEAGHWAIDCFAMRIEPRDGGPSLFSGAGRIEQDGNGGLRFTLYAKQDIGTPDLEAAGVLRPGLGEFVGPEGYVRLVARDTEHREWVGDAWIDKPPAVWFNPPPHTDHGSVWGGDVIVLRGTRETVRPGTDDIATCVSFVRLEIPGTAVTSTKIDSSRIGRRESALDRAAFAPLGTTCDLHAEQTRAVLTVWGKPPLDERIPLPVAEGLQFVLATPLEWAVTTVEGRQVTRTTIYSAALVAGRSDTGQFRLGMPGPDSSVSHREDTWRLLEQFVTYIAPDSWPDRRHWLAAQLGSALRSSTSTIETEALVTAVSVERIVKKLVPNTKAAKALSDLAKAGAVDPRYVKTWKKMRNAIAHGDDFDDDIPRAARQLNAVKTLMYTLVFHAIGYRGSYRDRGSAGWRMKQYDPGSPSGATQ